MDHELKQRLIGAVVVTALAAIFIPMLFDEPVDNHGGKAVTEINMPPPPEKQAQPDDGGDHLPASREQVMTQNEPGLAVSEIEEDERNARQDAEDDNNKPLASNQSNKSMMDSQSLQSKIAGLPAATGAETAGQETVPPEEEPDLNDTPDASAVPIAQEKKVPEKMDKTVKKAETIKPEHEATKDVAKPSSDTAKKAGGKLSRWSLQAGSFSKKENAQAMVDKLRKQGFPASIVAKGNLYRIKIGPELDKAKAAQMKSKLAAQKIQSYLQAE